MSDRLLTGTEAVPAALSVGAPAPTIMRAREAELVPGLPAGLAASMVLRVCQAHWLGNEPAVRARQVEGVHQMRVALRRLRAALVLFRAMAAPARLNSLDAEIKWLADLLGTARDWDVFLETTLTPIGEERAGEPGLNELRETVEELRGTAYDTVHAGLDSSRYTALVSEVAILAGDIQTYGIRPELRVEDLARHALDRRYTKVLRRGRRLAKLDPEQRHRLRIQLKKLRYCTDFFRAIFPAKRRKNFSDPLGDLQDMFGALNDAATAERLLQTLTTTEGSGARAVEAARAAGMISGWHAAETRHRRAGIAAGWKSFVAAKPFWR